MCWRPLQPNNNSGNISVSTATLTEQYTCRYCSKGFRREASLAVHVCEPKRRYQERNETGVQLGLRSYQRFFEITQGSARAKTFDDFEKSPYYRAFVKFGRHCVAIQAINVPRFVDWLLKNNRKIDHWCRDSVYGEYLEAHVRQESVSDALIRSLTHAMTWSDSTGYPDRDYLRYAGTNLICHAITTGRISAWVLYNCASGQAFLEQLNPEQVAITWPWIDSDYWTQRFRDSPEDTEYAREMLARAGW